MTVSQIGSYGFVSLVGTPAQLMGDKLDVIHRPGIDGAFVVRTGAFSRGAELTSIESCTKSEVESHSESYQALVGTVVTIYDAQGNSYTNQLVCEFVVENVFAISKPVGSLGASDDAMMICRWTVMPV